MTTKAVYQNGVIRPIKPEHLTRFKRTLAEGEVLEMTLSKPDDYAGTRPLKLFHALRDRYAMATGYSKQYAKDELLCRFGDAGPADEILADPPDWIEHARACRVWEQIYLRRSVKAYDKETLNYIIEMTAQATIEAGGSVDL